MVVSGPYIDMDVRHYRGGKTNARDTEGAKRRTRVPGIPPIPLRTIHARPAADGHVRKRSPWGNVKNLDDIDRVDEWIACRVQDSWRCSGSHERQPRKSVREANWKLNIVGVDRELKECE